MHKTCWNKGAGGVLAMLNMSSLYVNVSIKVKFAVCPMESAQSALLTYKDTFNHLAKTLRLVSAQVWLTRQTASGIKTEK